MYRVIVPKRPAPIQAAAIRFLLHGARGRLFQTLLESIDCMPRNIEGDVLGMLGIGYRQAG